MNFTQPQTQPVAPAKEEEPESRNPFVRSALFNLKKKDEHKRDDQSDKKEDASTDDEFAEFDVPAFLRDR